MFPAAGCRLPAQAKASERSSNLYRLPVAGNYMGERGGGGGGRGGNHGIVWTCLGRGKCTALCP